MCDKLHFNICKKTGVKLDKNQWHYRVPKRIREGKITDRNIPNNNNNHVKGNMYAKRRYNFRSKKCD